MSVFSVSLSQTHTFTKLSLPSITLLAGIGVLGDCHAGTTDQHLSRINKKPPLPNLRQVHLLLSEVFDLVQLHHSEGSSGEGNKRLQPGDLGENVTTVGIDLLRLGRGTKLHFVDGESSTAESSAVREEEHAVVTVTGLRNPCPKVDKFNAGLKEQFLVPDENRKVIGRTARIMGVVEVVWFGGGGVISPGMRIVIEEAEGFEKLDVV